MTRAQIDRRIYGETQREGLMGLWLTHMLSKDKRELRRKIEVSGRQ